MNFLNQLRNSYIMMDFKDDKAEKSAERPSSTKDKKVPSDKKPIKEEATKKEKVNSRHCSFLKNRCMYIIILFGVNIKIIYFVFMIRWETRLQN